MGDFWEQHCRLCLNPTNDESFEEITDVTKEIIDILFLKLSFDDKSKYVMCKACSLRLSEALKFKSTCLYTDNAIIPYVDGEKVFSVDLTEIYAIKVGNKELTCILDDLKVCRLCMKLIKGEFQLVNDKWIDLIEKYIPEMNIGVVQEPVVCAQCSSSFDSHSGFMQSCLDVEEKIKRVSEDEIVGTSSWARALNVFAETERDEMEFKEETEEVFADVKSRITSIKNESLDIKSEEEDEEVEDETSDAPSLMCVSKTETESDVSDEREEEDVAKKHKSLRGNTTKEKKIMEKDEKNEKDDSERQMYQCFYCTYKTKNLNSLTGHHRFKHKDKDVSGVPVYTCDTCGFQTRHKRSHVNHQIQHKKQAEGRKFKCDSCSFISLDWRKLELHELTHKKALEMPTYRCNGCKYQTNYKRNLARHLKRVPSHKNTFSGPPTRLENVETNKNFNGRFRSKNRPVEYKKCLLGKVPLYKCNRCNFKTMHSYSIKRHCLTHVSLTTTYISPKSQCESESRDASTPCPLKNQVLMYQCEKCPYRTHVKQAFISHWWTHKVPAKVTVYQCEKCHYRVTRKDCFRLHQLRHEDSAETIENLKGPKI